MKFRRWEHGLFGCITVIGAGILVYTGFLLLYLIFFLIWK